MKAATIVGLATTVLAAFEPLRLDVNIRRGNSMEDARGPDGHRPAFMKRAAGTTEMELKNARTYYYAELEVGSEKDKVSILVDTGSSDLWMMSHDVDCRASRYNQKRDFVAFSHHVKRTPTPTDDDALAPSLTDFHPKNKLFGWFTLIVMGGHPTGDVSGAPAASNTCVELGSFTTEGLSLWKVNSSEPAFYIQYADNTAAKGVWGHDTVSFGNVLVTDLSFAVANQSSSDVGVLGIGLPGLQTSEKQYLNLPMKLKEEGKIPKVLYLLYLDKADARTGSILFGGVDYAKIDSEFVTLPIVSLIKGMKEPVRLQVTLNSVELSAEGDQKVKVTDNAYPALLDSGTTLTYMPRLMLQRVASAVGAQRQLGQGEGQYVMNCVTDSNAFLTFDFGGQPIKVPFKDMQVNMGRGKCILGIMEQATSAQEGTYLVLGDNFLRHAYIVYDMEDYEISLAQVKFTDESDVRVVEDKLESALMASGVSTTFGNSQETLGGGSVNQFHFGNDGGDSDNSGKTGAASALRVSVVSTLGLAVIAGIFMV